MSDFSFEPMRGLPERLPTDERLLWQGAPSFRSLAVNAFHVRKIVIYFLVLGVLQAAAQLSAGVVLTTALQPFLWLVPMGLMAAAILTGVAWASARSTVYTITDKRLVMRIGIALPVTFNLPFKLIESASVRLFADGAGDIPVKLREGNRLAYLVIWPHAKPWEFVRPQPALRSIADADSVAQLLASALAAQPATRPNIEPANFAPEVAAA